MAFNGNFRSDSNFTSQMSDNYELRWVARRHAAKAVFWGMFGETTIHITGIITDACNDFGSPCVVA